MDQSTTSPGAVTGTPAANTINRSWLVEIAPGPARAVVGEFEEVSAVSVEVESGCLVFRDTVGVKLLRAAGTWLSCVPNDDPTAVFDG